MARPVPAGWNRDRVKEGLRTAMRFGQPTRATDQATFYLEGEPSGSGVDQEGVPYDPNVRPEDDTSSISVLCAWEFKDAQGQVEAYGSLARTRVEITLLDEDYQKVKGFKYVEIAGTRYDYAYTQPPVALADLDVWIVNCRTVDEQ